MQYIHSSAPVLALINCQSSVETGLSCSGDGAESPLYLKALFWGICYQQFLRRAMDSTLWNDTTYDELCNVAPPLETAAQTRAQTL